MKKLFASIVLFCALASIFVGCAHLAPGGAYATTGTAIDQGFYAVDSAFDLADATVDAVFVFERNNRAALWAASPDIKHELDKIRPKAVAFKRQYAVARAAYLKSPTEAGLSILKTTLGEIQQLASAAQTFLPK